MRVKAIIRNVSYSLLGILFIGAVIVLLRSPSNERNWSADQRVLATAEIADEVITLKNVRNISYNTTSDYTLAYYDKQIKLSELQTLDYLVETLEGFPGFAHTMFSFGFKDGSYISISVEIRKEQGESYHPISGMLRNYELMYVIADERDAVNLRANYRNDTVYLYPILISKESLDKLFISMLEKANELKTNPEFYHTLFSTCTTNLAVAASESTKEHFSKYHHKILLPGFSDELLLERGFIDTELNDIDKVREAFKINKLARQYQDAEDFSLKIRGR